MKKDKDLEPFGNIEPLPDEVVAEFEQKEDFQETANAIPASLLPLYEELSPEEQNKFKYHLDNLKDQAVQYGKLNGAMDSRIACVKEIANIAKAFIKEFNNVGSDDILKYSSNFVTKIQQTKFLELVIREWLQLYINAEANRSESGNNNPGESKSDVLGGISKVIATSVDQSS